MIHFDPLWSDTEQAIAHYSTEKVQSQEDVDLIVEDNGNLKFVFIIIIIFVLFIFGSFFFSVQAHGVHILGSSMQIQFHMGCGG